MTSSRPSRTRSPLALLLALAYFQVNVVGARAAEPSFWKERRRAVQGASASPATDLLAQLPAAARADFGRPVPVDASLPPLPALSDPSAAWLSSLVAPYGTLREFHSSSRPGALLVVHVQDAHEIEEAQRNIAGVVGAMAARGPVVVGLEGASGAFALEPYRAYADADVVRALAERSLARGDIGGAEFAGLTAPDPLLLWGVEDRAAYRANVRAFKDSLPGKKAVIDFLSRSRRTADGLKESVYSPALKEFDGRRAAYQSRAGALGDFARYLLSVRPDASPNVRLLVKALDAEAALDFKGVEAERLRLVRALAERLSPREAAELLKRSLEYRDGRAKSGEYHAYLIDVCRGHGLALSGFAGLEAYMEYARTADAIDRGALLTELSRLERAVQDALCRTPAERRLAAAVRRLDLMEKLAAHQMSPEDWAAYRADRAGVLGLRGELDALSGVPSGDGPALESLLIPLEDFCRLALERNAAFVENLLAKARAEKSRAAVLVAGGFHTEDLTRRLREAGASVAVVTPRITEVPRESRALDVFNRAPIPLETFFSGEVISLLSERVLQEDAAGIEFSPIGIKAYNALYALDGAALRRAAHGTDPVALDERAEAFARALGADKALKAEVTEAVSRDGRYDVLSYSLARPGETPLSCRVAIVKKEDLARAEESLKKEGTALDRSEFALGGETYVLAVFKSSDGRRSLAERVSRIFFEARAGAARLAAVHAGDLAEQVMLMARETIALGIPFDIVFNQLPPEIKLDARQKGLIVAVGGKMGELHLGRLQSETIIPWPVLEEILLAFHMMEIPKSSIEVPSPMEVAIHKSLAGHFIGLGGVTVYVRSHHGIHLAQAVDRYRAAVLYPEGEKFSFAVDARLFEAFAFLERIEKEVFDPAIKQELLKALVHREISVRRLREEGKSDEEAHRMVLDQAGQGELFKWISYFLVPAWRAAEASPPEIRAEVRERLYMYGAQALKLSRMKYTDHELSLLKGHPTLERLAHIFHHVVRLTDTMPYVVVRWGKEHPDHPMTERTVHDLIIAVSEHDVGKLYKDILDVFLSDEVIPLDAKEKREKIEDHETQNFNLAKLLLGREIPARQREILKNGGKVWKTGTLLYRLKKVLGLFNDDGRLGKELADIVAGKTGDEDDEAGKLRRGIKTTLDELWVAVRGNPWELLPSLHLACHDAVEGITDETREYKKRRGNRPGLQTEVYGELENRLKVLSADPRFAPVVEAVLLFYKDLLSKDEAFIRSLERTYPEEAAVRAAVHSADMEKDLGRVLDPGEYMDVVLAAVKEYSLLTLRSPPSQWWPLVLRRTFLTRLDRRDRAYSLRALAARLLTRSGLTDSLRVKLEKLRITGDSFYLIFNKKELISLLSSLPKPPSGGTPSGRPRGPLPGGPAGPAAPSAAPSLQEALSEETRARVTRIVHPGAADAGLVRALLGSFPNVKEVVLVTDDPAAAQAVEAGNEGLTVFSSGERYDTLALPRSAGSTLVIDHPDARENPGFRDSVLRDAGPDGLVLSVPGGPAADWGRRLAGGLRIEEAPDARGGFSLWTLNEDDARKAAVSSLSAEAAAASRSLKDPAALAGALLSVMDRLSSLESREAAAAKESVETTLRIRVMNRPRSADWGRIVDSRFTIISSPAASEDLKESALSWLAAQWRLLTPAQLGYFRGALRGDWSSRLPAWMLRRVEPPHPVDDWAEPREKRKRGPEGKFVFQDTTESRLLEDLLREAEALIQGRLEHPDDVLDSAAAEALKRFHATLDPGFSRRLFAVLGPVLHSAGSDDPAEIRRTLTHLNGVLVRSGLYLHVGRGTGRSSAAVYRIDDSVKAGSKDHALTVAYLRPVAGGDPVSQEDVLLEAPSWLAPVTPEGVEKEALEVLLPAAAGRTPEGTDLLAASLVQADWSRRADPSLLGTAAAALAWRADVAGRLRLLLAEDGPETRRRHAEAADLLDKGFPLILSEEEAASLGALARDLGIAGAAEELEDIRRAIAGLNGRALADLLDQVRHSIIDSRSLYALARMDREPSGMGERIARFSQFHRSFSSRSDMVLFDAAIREKRSLSLSRQDLRALMEQAASRRTNDDFETWRRAIMPSALSPGIVRRLTPSLRPSSFLELQEGTRTSPDTWTKLKGLVRDFRSGKASLARVIAEYPELRLKVKDLQRLREEEVRDRAGPFMETGPAALFEAPAGRTATPPSLRVLQGGLADKGNPGSTGSVAGGLLRRAGVPSRGVDSYDRFIAPVLESVAGYFGVVKLSTIFGLASLHPFTSAWLAAALGLWVLAAGIVILVHIPADLADGSLARGKVGSWLWRRAAGALFLTSFMVFLPPAPGAFISGILHVAMNHDAVESRKDPNSPALLWSVIPSDRVKAFIDQVRRAWLGSDGENLDRLLRVPEESIAEPDQLAQALAEIARISLPLGRRVAGMVRERGLSKKFTAAYPSLSPRRRKALLRSLEELSRTPSLASEGRRAYQDVLLALRKEPGRSIPVKNIALPVHVEVTPQIPSQPIKARTSRAASYGLALVLGSLVDDVNAQTYSLLPDMRRLLPGGKGRSAFQEMYWAADDGDAVRFSKALKNFNEYLLGRGLFLSLRREGRRWSAAFYRVEKTWNLEASGRSATVVRVGFAEGVPAREDLLAESAPAGVAVVSMDRVRRDVVETVLPAAWWGVGAPGGREVSDEVNLAAARLIQNDFRFLWPHDERTMGDLGELSELMSRRAALLSRVPMSLRPKADLGPISRRSLKDLRAAMGPKEFRELEAVNEAFVRRYTRYAQLMGKLTDLLAESADILALSRVLSGTESAWESIHRQTQLAVGPARGIDLVLMFSRLLDARRPPLGELGGVFSLFHGLAVGLSMETPKNRQYTPEEVQDVFLRLGNSEDGSDHLWRLKLLSTISSEQVDKGLNPPPVPGKARSFRALYRRLELEKKGRQVGLVESYRHGDRSVMKRLVQAGLKDEVIRLVTKGRIKQLKPVVGLMPWLGIAGWLYRAAEARARLGGWRRALPYAVVALFGVLEEAVIRRAAEPYLPDSLVGPLAYAVFFATLLHFFGVYVGRETSPRRSPWYDLMDENRFPLAVGSLILGLAGQLLFLQTSLPPGKVYLILGLVHGAYNVFARRRGGPLGVMTGEKPAAVPMPETALLDGAVLGGPLASRTLRVTRLSEDRDSFKARLLARRDAGARARGGIDTSFEGLAVRHALEEAPGGDEAALAERQAAEVDEALLASAEEAYRSGGWPAAERRARADASAYNGAMGFENAADRIAAAARAGRPPLFELSAAFIAGGELGPREREMLDYLRSLAAAEDFRAPVPFLLPPGAAAPAARAALAREGLERLADAAVWVRKEDTAVGGGLHSVEALLRLAQPGRALGPMDVFLLDRREWRLEPRMEALAELLLPWAGGWARNATRAVEGDVRRVNLVLGMA